MIAALIVGCANHSPRVNEYLDDETGVSIRSMAAPFIYARGIREAANLRDYISIGAVEVNRMGARQQYLAVVLFSDAAHAPMERVALTLDGQPQQFAMATHEPRTLGIGHPPFRPLYGYVGEIWYAVTPADLRAFAAAPPESIELIETGRNLTYFTFERADAPLSDFISEIPDAAVIETQRR